MYYIDPHIHMVSRTTDDYETLARMGCVAMSEPAFWAGYDRCWLCINAKEAENVKLSREVLKLIPEFLDRPNVLGIGEIGLNKNTRNEAIIFQEHVELAIEHHQQDKHQGTRMILDMLADHHAQLPAERVLVDHVEEHTVKPVLDAGYWAGMTLYPVTKCTPSRAVDIIEMVGAERLCVNSAGDWGPSKPTAVPDLIMEMRRRGHRESLIRKIVFDNPREFFQQNKSFDLADPESR